MMSTPTYTEAITVEAGQVEEFEPRFQFLPWIGERGVVVVTILLIVAAALFIDAHRARQNFCEHRQAAISRRGIRRRPHRGHDIARGTRQQSR